MYFSPHVAYSQSIAALTGGTVTAWGGYTANGFSTGIGSTNDGYYRVVSWGLKYETTLPWTSASGTITISECTEFAPLAVGQTVSSLNYGVNAEFAALRDAKFSLIGRPQGPKSMDYMAFADTSYPAYTSYMFFVGGAPLVAQPVGSFEYIVNYEWTPRTNVGYNFLTSPANPSIDHVMSTRSNAAGSLPMVLNGNKQEVDKSVVEAVLHSVGASADSIASVGGQALATAGSLKNAYEVGSKLAPFARGAAMMIM